MRQGTQRQSIVEVLEPVHQRPAQVAHTVLVEEVEPRQTLQETRYYEPAQIVETRHTGPVYPTRHHRLRSQSKSYDRHNVRGTSVRETLKPVRAPVNPHYDGLHDIVQPVVSSSTRGHHGRDYSYSFGKANQHLVKRRRHQSATRLGQGYNRDISQGRFRSTASDNAGYGRQGRR